MTDISALMDKAERLQTELHDIQRQIMDAVAEQAIESAAVALAGAAQALRIAEHLPARAEQRTFFRSKRRLVEAQLGWSAA